MTKRLRFDRVADIEQYVAALPPLTGALPCQMLAFDKPPAHEYNVYCPRLRQGFRSEYERALAWLMVMEWHWDVAYEPLVLVMGSTYYIPDFFIRDKCFIEVKGDWRLGAKRKFTKASECIGYDRMLLVDKSLYREVMKRANLRQIKA